MQLPLDLGFDGFAREQAPPHVGRLLGSGRSFREMLTHAHLFSLHGWQARQKIAGERSVGVITI
ncbi:MAG: hypothetical protein D6722_05020 [Bacteroidetes bacterium]|nr:MAG: hypothetical protein D6722_05020 [Bacteroidota bacterium]